MEIGRSRQAGAAGAGHGGRPARAGPVDGDPGPRTRNAIAQFRADYGLSPGTGVDPELVGALRVAGRDAPAVARGSERSGGQGLPWRAPQAIDPPLWSEPEGPAAAIAMDGGTMMVDGRVAAAAGGSDNLSKGLDYQAMAATIERLIFQHRMALRPGAFEDDDTARLAVGIIEPEFATELLEGALRRPLTKQEANAVARRLVARDVLGKLTPFEERDLLDEVRANADRIVPPDLPKPPVPLRVFCEVRLGAYDFETQSFPIYDTRACNGNVRGAQGAKIEGPDPVPEAADGARRGRGREAEPARGALSRCL